jgi:surface antigen
LSTNVCFGRSEKYIRNLTRALDNPYKEQVRSKSKKSLYRRLTGKLLKKSRKRTVRYSILAANVLLLAAVLVFVISSSSSGQTARQGSVASSVNAAVSPLDQLSSADVAVNVAHLTNLTEATSVSNHADTVNALLAISPSDQAVIAKPVIVETAFKSNKDIQVYITKAGDTVADLAKRFNVTSDSIINSNNLSSNQLSAGQTLYIPPVNGIVYIVKAGDTPTTLANKYNASIDQITAYNDAEIGGLKVGERIIIPNGVVPIVRTNPTALLGSFGFTASFGANGYDFGWCTWYAANRRAQLGHPVPSNLGDAYSWFFLAQRAGLPTGYAPRVGAVVVSLGADHVSVVESVNADGSFIISEMNSRGYDSINTIGQPGHAAGGWDRIDYKTIASASGLGFIY